jgi:hypothetical protein
MKKERRITVAHKKRHGLHQKQTKHFVKTYWPYLPLVLSLAITFALSGIWQHVPRAHTAVLAYATSVSKESLLEETNTQRTNNGRDKLELNSKLSEAAQAKANDMSRRDYWSHNTPDGKEPWVFIDNTGYVYEKAGENLAYGFASSASTVAGWMNSPSHKENLLDSAFKEVGFGYANSENYQATGEQTIVVAMYALPLNAVHGATAATGAPTEPVPAPTPAAAPTTTTTPAAPTDETTPSADIPVTTRSKDVTGKQKTIARIQTLTNGYAPWSVIAASIFMIVGLTWLGFKHSRAVHRSIVKGEKYVLHHGLFDITLLSWIITAFMLTRGVGTIL